MKVERTVSSSPLHVLGMELAPLNGYVARTLDLVAEQRRAGAEPFLVTPPFQPRWQGLLPPQVAPFTRRVVHPAVGGGGSSLGDRLCRALYALRRGVVAGTAVSGAAAAAGSPATARRRRRLRSLGKPLLALEERLLMRHLERRLVALGEALRPTVVHAHSPHRSALPALAAARRLRLPAVYEVRGLWEESAVADGTLRRGSAAYRAWERGERRAVAAAGAVVTLGEALREELIRRGAEGERVVVVPNAVGGEQVRRARLPDATAVSLPPALTAWCETHAAATIYGYVGSLRPLEGVDTLVRVVARLVADGHDAALLVVGDGTSRPALEALAADLGLGERARFAGRLERAEAFEAYRRLDVFVVSRPDRRVTRLVPPIKPLEAMLRGLPLVVSDLPALRELVRDGETGLLAAAADVASFAAACRRLDADPALRRRLGEAARRWVLAERTWERNLGLLEGAYEVAHEVAERGR